MRRLDEAAGRRPPTQHLRLPHAALDLWVDVRLREIDGRWLAVADLADQPDVGTATDPRVALEEALISPGPRLAYQLSVGAGLDEARGADEG